MRHCVPLLVGFLALSACTGAGAKSARTVDVAHVPITSTDGTSTDLARLAGGKPVVVSLWAPWCEGCRDEEPALVRLEELARSRKDFVLVSVAIGTTASELPSPAPKYARYLDSGAFADYGARRVPATLVLGRDGKIVYEGGALDRAALDALDAAVR